MNFQGMDTEVGKELASDIKTAASEFVELYDNVTSTVNGVEWQGPDYDQYRDDWQSFISGPLSNLGELLTAMADELQADADEQDDTSAG